MGSEEEMIKEHIARSNEEDRKREATTETNENGRMSIGVRDLGSLGWHVFHIRVGFEELFPSLPVLLSFSLVFSYSKRDGLRSLTSFSLSTWIAHSGCKGDTAKEMTAVISYRRQQWMNAATTELVGSWNQTVELVDFFALLLL